MKNRDADLQKHFRQAFDYWTRITDGRPPYVVLCNFDEFWIYEFDSDHDAPEDKLDLTNLPERWGRSLASRLVRPAISTGRLRISCFPCSIRNARGMSRKCPQPDRCGKNDTASILSAGRSLGWNWAGPTW